MRIVINTLGTFGDMHPYIPIARELQSRGRVPVIATMEIYRELETAGFEFFPVRPNVLDRNNYHAPRVFMELRELIARPEYARNAAALSRQLKQKNGPARAAERIEHVLVKSPEPDEELIHAAGD